MKKGTYILILLLSLLIAISTCSLYREQSVGVINLQYLKSDTSILYMDNKNVIYHLDKTGKILMKKKLPSQENGMILEYMDICGDKNDRIYLLVLGIGEDGSIKQWIEQWDKNGKHIKHIIERELDMDLYELDMDLHELLKMQSIDGKLAIFYTLLDQNVLHFDLFDTETEEIVTREYSFDEMPPDGMMNCTSKGSVYYIDLENRFYCLDNRSRGQYQYEIKSEDYGFAPNIAKYMFADNTGMIYYTDVYNMNLMKYNESLDELSIVYTQKEKIDDTLLFEDIHKVRIEGDNIFALLNFRTYGDTGFYIKEGDTSYIITEQYIDTSMLIFYFVLVWIISFLILCCIVWIFIRLRNAHSILVKQLASLILFLVTGIVAVSISIYQLFIQKMTYDVYEELYMLSQNIALSINKDALQEIPLPLERNQSYSSIGNIELLFGLDEFHEIFDETIEKEYYCNVYATRNDVDYLFFGIQQYDMSNQRGINRIDAEANILLLESYENSDRTVQFERAEANGSTSLYCIYSILDDETGEVIGKIEIGILYDYFIYSIKGIMFHFTSILIMVFIILIFILTMQTKRNLRGLSKLRNGVYEISNGHWGTVVDVRSNDEIEEIANAFNRMSVEIGSYMEYIEGINLAYAKFVSKETIQLLEKKSVVDVSIGDTVNREMTILSVNIENIYSLNESMTAAETFSFMNLLYQNIVLEVVRSGGNIEKYTDEGLRALYQKNVENSLDCSLRILERIDNLQSNIEMSIVLQNGEIMYGIAGTEEKAEAVAVSEILNYTYMLKEIAHINGIRLLITAPVYHAITNKEDYNFRYIGKIKNKKNQNVFLDLYDVLDGYTVDEKIRKKSTRELFQKGVLFFQAGELKEARKAFVDVLRNDSNDALSQSYLLLCDKFMQDPPKSWSGYFS